jgi:hypothetical protein
MTHNKKHRSNNEIVEEFDSLLSYDKILYDTESGWRIAVDSKKLKGWLLKTLQDKDTECERRVEEKIKNKK